MIKKIKRTKEMRLDELIKYIWDNDVKGELYNPINSGYRVKVNEYGIIFFSTITGYREDGLYTVEVEEDITEDTEFESVAINTEKSLYSFQNKSIKECRFKFPKVTEIFARIDGRLYKVWERE